jgi:hypothetical protein
MVIMKINNTTKLTNFLIKKAQLQNEIQLVALKITPWRTLGEKEKKRKHQNPMVCGWNKFIFGLIKVVHPLPTSKYVACIFSWEFHKKLKKIAISGVFEQKFTTPSCKFGI